MVLQNVQQREVDMNPAGEMQYVKGTSLTSFS